MPKRLTPAKGRIYCCIRSAIQKQGYAPSHREIMSACGLKSTSSVKYAIDALVRDGWLIRGDKYTARSLSLPRHKGKATLDEQAATWLELNTVLVWHTQGGIPVGFEAWQYGKRMGTAGLIEEKPL